MTIRRSFGIPFFTAIAAAISSLAGCSGTSGSDGPAATARSGPPAPTGSGVIAGVVKFDGPPPPREPIRVGADPACNAKHAADPPLSEDIVVNLDGTLRDVIVHVTVGLPAGSYPATTSPVVLDQDGCRYRPHVVTLAAGQPLEVRNSDDTIHNINGQGKQNQPFNFSMISNRVPPRTQTFAKAEMPPFKIKCDVHPWMMAWCAVFDHPYHGVTGADGRFALAGLPDGTYTVTAWHRELGTREATVTVSGATTATATFTFAAKK